MSEYWKGLTVKGKVKFIFSLIVGIIGVVFATLNWNEAEVNLIFIKTQLPLTMVIVFSIIIGFALSYVFRQSKKSTPKNTDSTDDE